MANITLPTEAQVRAVDANAFIVDDLMDGLITDPQGQVIKLVAESVSANATINIHEANAGTGKTAKFILDNVNNSSNINIVTTDTFVDTYLTTSEFYENVGNASNCYKCDTSSMTRTNFNEGGTAISVDQLDAFGSNANAILQTITLADAPTLMGTNDLSNYEHPAIPNTHIVNHAGASLASSGNFESAELSILFPWPVSMGFPEHEVNANRKHLASMFNRCPSGGGIIVFNFHLGPVQTAFWDVMNAMKNTGNFWTSEWLLNSETDNSGYWQAAVVKKS